MCNSFKFPVPELAAHIQDQWAVELAGKLNLSVSEVRAAPIDLLSTSLAATRIELMDESVVEFRNAFFIVSEKRRTIAVFTEHCGYHLFPYHEAKIFADGKLVFQQI